MSNSTTQTTWNSQGNSNASQNYLIGALFLIIYIISATTSALFFARNLPSYFAGLIDNDALAFLVTGAMGAMFLDTAAIGWHYISKRDADQTIEQISIARGAFVILGLMALLASGVYILMEYRFKGTLIEGSAGVALNMLAVLLITGALTINMGALLAYQHSSPAGKAKRYQAAMKARMFDRVANATERAQQEIEDQLVADIIAQNLPQWQIDTLNAFTSDSANKVRPKLPASNGTNYERPKISPKA